MKSRILAIAIAMFTFGFLAVLMPAPASAASSGEFIADINALRASKGLPALTVNGSLSGFAQGWAGKMAEAGSISHNPNLKNAPGNWTAVGENVGVGGSEKAIFNALVASSGHYANMVSTKYNTIGVGVVTGNDGRIYTTHNFAFYPAASSSSSSSPKPSSTTSKPAATTAPKVTTAPKTSTKPTTTQASSQTTQTSTTPSTETPAVPVTSAPSERILQGTIEIGNIAVQG